MCAYFAVGVPRVLRCLPEEGGARHEAVLSLAFTHCGSALLAVVTTTTLQHRIKLAEYARDAASLSIDGVNLKAVWRPGHCALALLTSAGRVLLFELVGAPGGAPQAGLPASVAAQLPRACALRLLGELPLGLAEAEQARDVAAAPDFLLAGTDRGAVAQVTWGGRLRGRCDLGAQPSERSAFARRSLSAATFLVLASDGEEVAAGDGDSTPGRGWTPAAPPPPPAGVASLCLCLPLRLLAVVYDSGAAAVLSGLDDDGGFAAEALSVDAWLAHAHAVAVALAPASRLAAVGTAQGTVALHALAEGCRPLRTLSLADWGYSPADTGAAHQLAWAPDGRALACGYARRGAAVWSSSGCRLVHAMRPGGGGGAPLPAPPNSSRWSVAPARGAPTSPAAEVLDAGVAALAWSGCGAALLLGGGAHAGCLLELALARPLPQRRCCLATWAGAQLLQAADALLVVEAGDGPDGAADGGGAVGAGSGHGGAGPPPGAEPRGVAQLRLPRAYLADNWPLTHAAVSEDGLHVAAAGRRGLAVRPLRSDRWRVFGDVAQERSVAAAALLWLGPAVVVVNHAAAIAGAGTPAAAMGGFDASPAGAPASVRAAPALVPRDGAAYELLVFPRARLDAAALLARLPLAAAPLAVDALGGDYLMVATAPLCITVYAANWRAPAAAGGATQLTLTAVREVRVATPRPPPLALVLAPPSRAPPPHAGSRAALPAAHAASPAAAAVLHADGELAVLDLRSGRQRAVAFDVDDFWLPVAPPPGGQDGGDAALAALAPPGVAAAPWWVYGAGGMRLLQPDDVAAPGAGGDDDASFAESADPELVFDRESYPLGLAPGPGAVVWLTQRLAAAGGGHLPCFEAAPKAQPVLPCLLRHLLRRGADADAATLARTAEGRPHFTHSMEWLLFSALDAHVSRRGSSTAAHAATPAPARTASGAGGADAAQAPHIAASSVLARAVALIAAFPEFADVVVSVARKTDEKEWRALFAATGSPSALFEACLSAGRLRTAACFLLIIDKLEGAAAGQDAALRLLQASMDGGVEYPLAGELVRFLVRSGREYALAEEAASAEAGSPPPPQQAAPQAAPSGGRGWLSGLSALAFGTSAAGATAAGRPPRAAAAAAQARAQALHSRVAGVLTAHARQLLAARELPRLAALARGTLFSLPDFFAAERGGPAARLGDFARALNSLREAVGSLDEPGAREDCELVLAALQRAGLLDWTVVVATLLQRRSLLRAAFAREPELWRVWAAAMRSPVLRDEDGTLAALLAALEADLAQARG